MSKFFGHKINFGPRILFGQLGPSLFSLIPFQKRFGHIFFNEEHSWKLLKNLKKTIEFFLMFWPFLYFFETLLSLDVRVWSCLHPIHVWYLTLWNWDKCFQYFTRLKFPDVWSVSKLLATETFLGVQFQDSYILIIFF